MVNRCCAPDCHNNSGDGKGYAFYRIPKDLERRQKWIAAIQRARSKGKKSQRCETSDCGARLCSEHFISGKKSDNRLSPDYVPSIFKHVTSQEKRRMAKLLEVFNRKHESRLQRMEQKRKSSPATADIPLTDCSEEGRSDVAEIEIVIGGSPEKSSHNEPQCTPEHLDNPATPPCASKDCKLQIQSLESECQALRTENILLKEKMNRIRLSEMSLQSNDKKVNVLTGLPTFSILMTLFKFVAPFLKHNSDLTSFQQYMLTLIKLRMNLSFEFLAYYFAIDSTTVSKLFKHCISVMYCRLVPSLIRWPDRKSLRKSLPYAFRNSSFERTVCIIGCFEITIEKPSDLLASTQCYSVNKSCHTMKYLIAICPQGSTSFVSNGWGGRTSNKFITEQSNFLRNLLPGDLVLADRGFNVSKGVHSYQSEIKIPAFTRGKKQLDPVELESTRCLASLRIHIERVMGVHCQKYTILQSTVPIFFTDIDRENDVTFLDKIVSVCCALTNASESVIPFE